MVTFPSRLAGSSLGARPCRRPARVRCRRCGPGPRRVGLQLAREQLGLVGEGAGVGDHAGVAGGLPAGSAYGFPLAYSGDGGGCGAAPSGPAWGAAAGSRADFEEAAAECRARSPPTRRRSAEQAARARGQSPLPSRGRRRTQPVSVAAPVPYGYSVPQLVPAFRPRTRPACRSAPRSRPGEIPHPSHRSRSALVTVAANSPARRRIRPPSAV